MSNRVPKPPRLVNPQADFPYDPREFDRWLQTVTATVNDLMSRVEKLEKEDS